MNNNVSEATWRRALSDSASFRHSGWFFWGCEVLGAAAFAAMVTYFILPDDPSRFESAAYPLGGVVIGFVATYAVIYLWNLLRAPYRQRDALRKSIRARESSARRSQPLDIPRSSPDQSGGTRFERLCVHNPNDHAVPDCYGRLVKSEIEGARPDAYKGPPEGYHFPWSTHGGNSTHAAIGAHSEDYLDLFFAVGPEAKKCYTPQLNQLTGKIEQAHPVLVGRHRLIIEVGSKTYDIPPQRFEVIVEFGGGVDLSVTSIKPFSDSEESR